ncbi:uncharacterized protein LOC144356700 [Saccoglossus kowalevskii]
MTRSIVCACIVALVILGNLLLSQFSGNFQSTFNMRVNQTVAKLRSAQLANLRNSLQDRERRLEKSIINVTTTEATLGLNSTIIAKALTRVMSLAKLEQALYTSLLTGRELHIGVVGGSISTATAVGRSNLYLNVLQKMLNDSGIATRIHNGAIGATGSQYHLYCMDSHLKLHELDVLFWECAENDWVYKNGCIHHEELTRRILLMQSPPQLIYVNFIMGLTARKGKCENAAHKCSKALSEHYNIPSISLPDSVCEKIKAKKLKDLISPVDKYHPSARAHKMVAIYLFHLFKLAIETTYKNISERNTYKIHTSDRRKSIPPALSNNTYDIVKVQCWSSMEPETAKKIPFIVKDRGNWTFDNVSLSKGRLDRKNSWVSMTAGQKITLQVPIEPYKNLLGKIYIAFIRGRSSGQARIWLDGNIKNNRVVDTARHTNECVLKTVWTDVIPGNHTVTIQSVNKGLRIVAITSVYGIRANVTQQG